MKLITILITLIFLWIDHQLKIRNSILLLELLFLAIFYFGGQYATRTLRHRKQKQRCLREYKGYVTPKENKDWRSYTSKIEIQRTREKDLFDRI